MSQFENHGFKPEKKAEQVKAEKPETKVEESESDILKRKEQLATDTKAQESEDNKKIEAIREKMGLGGMAEGSLSKEEMQDRKKEFSRMNSEVNKGLGGMAMENVSAADMRKRLEEDKKRRAEVNKGLGGMAM